MERAIRGAIACIDQAIKIASRYEFDEEAAAQIRRALDEKTEQLTAALLDPKRGQEFRF